jgi:secondary thiamine-phosphate synthase enzyme
MSKLALSAVEARPKVTTREGTYKVVSTTLTFATKTQVEMKTITEEIAAFVKETAIQDGLVQVTSMHTTAGLIVNETQDALLADMATMFEQVIPSKVYYKHNDPAHSDCDRGNAAAHLRLSFVGHSVSLPLVDGQLKLGTWQNILLTEFDGPNNRNVHIQVMGI